MWNPWRNNSAKLDRILAQLETIVTQQGDIDSAVTGIQNFLTDVGTDVTDILSDVTAWKNGQPSSVDTSGLDSAIAGIGAVKDNLDSAVSSLNSVATGGTTPGTGDPTTPPVGGTQGAGNAGGNTTTATP